MKIAVTGGNGFIGRAVIADAVKRGHDAVSLDLEHGHDVTDTQGFSIGDVDTVIHLAGMLGTAELFDAPYAAVNVNVVGTLNVLEQCRIRGAGYVGITMPDSSWPSIYQATKLAAMRLASAYHNQYGIRVSHVRAFNAYGPGQKHGPGHPQKIIPTFATEAWAGRPIPIWGDGSQTVDLVHVDHVARMLVDATAFDDDEVFDAGTGEPYTVKCIAQQINAYCGQPTDNIMYLSMRAGETPGTNIVAEGDGWAELDWAPMFSLNSVLDTVWSYRP